MPLSQDQRCHLGLQDQARGLADASDEGKRLAPDEQARRTMGFKLIGRLTLDQYEQLIGLGLDGDKIKAWSAHRANQEIIKRTAKARH